MANETSFEVDFDRVLRIIERDIANSDWSPEAQLAGLLAPSACDEACSLSRAIQSEMRATAARDPTARAVLTSDSRVGTEVFASALLDVCLAAAEDMTSLGLARAFSEGRAVDPARDKRTSWVFEEKDWHGDEIVRFSARCALSEAKRDFERRQDPTRGRGIRDARDLVSAGGIEGRSCEEPRTADSVVWLGEK